MAGSAGTTGGYDRAAHTYGKSYADYARTLARDFSPAPDVVAFPATESDVVDLLDWADGAGAAVIPFGAGSSVVGGTEGLTRRWAERKLRRLFPDLGALEFADAWHGQIAFTPDHLFRIHRLDDGLYSPVGYNGRGITTGTMFGRALADLFSGASEDSLPLPITDLKPDRGRAVKTQLYRSAFLAKQAAESLL